MCHICCAVLIFCPAFSGVKTFVHAACAGFIRPGARTYCLLSVRVVRWFVATDGHVIPPHTSGVSVYKTNRFITPSSPAGRLDRWDLKPEFLQIHLENSSFKSLGDRTWANQSVSISVHNPPLLFSKFKLYLYSKAAAFLSLTSWRSVLKTILFYFTLSVSAWRTCDRNINLLPVCKQRRPQRVLARILADPSWKQPI